MTIWVNSAQASTTINAEFKATKACETFQSLRRRTNLGNFKTTSGTIYQVRATKKYESYDYLLIVDPKSRSLYWVSVDCGILLTNIENSSTASLNRIKKETSSVTKSSSLGTKELIEKREEAVKMKEGASVDRFDDLREVRGSVGRFDDLTPQGTHGSGGGVNDFTPQGTHGSGGGVTELKF